MKIVNEHNINEERIAFYERVIRINEKTIEKCKVQIIFAKEKLEEIEQKEKRCI